MSKIPLTLISYIFSSHNQHGTIPNNCHLGAGDTASPTAACTGVKRTLQLATAATAATAETTMKAQEVGTHQARLQFREAVRTPQRQ